MEGRYSYELIIATDGSVASVRSSMSGGLTQDVGSCIDDVLRSLRFSPPEAGRPTRAGSFSFVNANKGK